jgi:YD repeat-containing protein
MGYNGILLSGVTRPDGSSNFYGYTGPNVTTAGGTGSDNQYFSYTYDNQIDSTWGPRTRTQHNTYDGSRRLSQSSFAGGLVISYTYDAMSRVSQTTDAGRVSTYTYDATTGNLNQETLPGSRVTTTTFDNYGRTATVTPPVGGTYAYAYDTINRVLSDSLQAPGTPVVAHYSYDALYQTGVQDQNGNTTTTSYNALGWATQVTDASSNSMTYRYDASGLQTSFTNRRGQLVSMTYDNAGRVTSKTGTNTSADYFRYSSNDREVVDSNSVATNSTFIDQGTYTSTPPIGWSCPDLVDT